MFSQLPESSFYVLTILIASSAVILLGWLYMKHVISTCHHCGERFEKASKLRNHIIKAHHKKIKSKRCFICDKEFKNGSLLLYHCKTVHDVIDYSFKSCPICNHHFKNSKELLEHNMDTHDVIDYPADQGQGTSNKVA